LGIEVKVTDNKDEYQSSPFIKINYSIESLDGISVFPKALLYETILAWVNPAYKIYKGLPVLFWTDQEADIPFDIFAASFFMISRYEEYLPQPLDMHGRVNAEDSVAYQHSFLHIPVVDHWSNLLKNEIIKRYPGTLFPSRVFTYIPTIDVDIAFAYLYRNLTRFTGATLKSIVKGDFEDNLRRFRTILSRERDPFDTYDLASELFDEFDLQPVFFFLLGRYGKFDRNIPVNSEEFQQLIRKINQKYAVGIHPSYRSNEERHRLKLEIGQLEKITNRTVIRSRQHFLKMKMPETYQLLVSAGITEDYSMGYPSQAGFRAGTCTPFHFYDLSAESETSLLVYPFQVMDGTLNHYLGLTPAEAVVVIFRLIEEVKKVKGTFISVWHNESLSEIREWKSWREVYYQLTRAACGN